MDDGMTGECNAIIYLFVAITYLRNFEGTLVL